ncbi:plasmid recombination protein [Salmonella enterica]|nr:plasmid recombination protein [Salmonella enterica]EJB9133524.1 plasmid recombination protein [Salmonella enterica]EJC0271818.1 plasmid recombination protein [Salmonella enterica]EJC0379767.1 plasmid recombination protein [Salmonella enterica]EJC0499512.1 plasmid recombination protein [Salmonella enterica]
MLRPADVQRIREGRGVAAYAIMRCKKLAKMGNVAAILKHAYRERETPNADASRTPENEHWAASSTDEAMGRLRELLPEKRRKDAVLAVEYVMTASPEWWKSASQEQQAAFFEKAHEWLANKYGADRIVTASIHRDETSPHMTAFVVPLTQDGRLSAKEFIGNKAQMTHDQTTFAAAVADLGLQRGIEGSKARHTRIQAFYEALERPPAHVTIEASAVQPKVLRKGIFSRDVETPEAVAERLTKAVRKGYEPAVIAAAGAREMAQKAKQAQETARDLRDRLKPVLEALGPLNKDMQGKAAAIIKAVGEKLLAEQKEQQRQKLAERQQNRPSRGRDRGR